MRNTILASLLGASTVAAVMPHVGGPVHFRVTQPHSVSAVRQPTTGGVAFPVTPLEFIVTDITFGAQAGSGAIELKANGATVFVGRYSSSDIRLATGFVVPAGATLTAQMTAQVGVNPTMLNSGITLSGYIQ